MRKRASAHLPSARAGEDFEGWPPSLRTLPAVEVTGWNLTIPPRTGGHYVIGECCEGFTKLFRYGRSHYKGESGYPMARAPHVSRTGWERFPRTFLRLLERRPKSRNGSISNTCIRIEGI